MVWVLAFFLIAAGVAEGAERCGQECCRELRMESNFFKVQEITRHPEALLDAILPSCHLPLPFRVLYETVPQDPACNEGSSPSCCYLKKDGTFVPALVSESRFGGNNLFFQMDMMAHVQLRIFQDEHEACFAAMGRLLHPRAAPIPLYLKNTSFIC